MMRNIVDVTTTSPFVAPDGSVRGGSTLPGAPSDPNQPSSLSQAMADLGGPNMPQRKFVSLLGQRAAATLQNAPGLDGHAPLTAQASVTSGGSDSGLLSGIEEDKEVADGAGIDEGSFSDDEYEVDDDVECYHEIHAIPLLDPVLDKQVGLRFESRCG